MKGIDPLMETLHSILYVCCIVADIAVPVAIILSVAIIIINGQKIKKDPSTKKSGLPVILIVGTILLAIVMNFLYFAVAVKKYAKSEESVDELPGFSVTSESLHDGEWDTEIGRNSENKSPQLSWDPVSGAKAYSIIMIDETASNWMHWKTSSVTTAGVDLGYATSDSYVGPYPPNGETHVYTVYIVALKEPKDGFVGMLDAPNNVADHDLKRSLNSLDIYDNGKTGNAIAIGTITGTYSSRKK